MFRPGGGGGRGGEKGGVLAMEMEMMRSGF